MNISVPGGLAAEVRERDIPISAICQRALGAEVKRLRALEDSGGMEQITVGVGEPSVTVGFTGRWLVCPDPDGTRAVEDGYDAGAYWGVALTQKGRIAVYLAHCNDGFPASLKDYDSLDEASEDAPADIIAQAASALGEEYVLWRDI
jgi:hypothetical protein